MRLTLRGDAIEEPGDGDLGLHFYGDWVELNTEASGPYLALERPEARLYRLTRDGDRLVRTEQTDGLWVEGEYRVPGNRILRSRWWFTDALGDGLWAMWLPPRDLICCALDERGRFWWVSDLPACAVDELMADFPREEEEDDEDKAEAWGAALLAALAGPWDTVVVAP